MGAKQIETKKEQKKEQQVIQEKPYYVKEINISNNPYNKPENIIVGFDEISAKSEWYNFAFVEDDILVNAKRYYIYFWNIYKSDIVYKIRDAGYFLQLNKGIFIYQRIITNDDALGRGTNDIIIFDYYEDIKNTKKLPNNNKILALTKYDDSSFLYFDEHGNLYHYFIENSIAQLITTFPIKNKTIRINIQNFCSADLSNIKGEIEKIGNGLILVYYNSELYLISEKSKEIISTCILQSGIMFINILDGVVTPKYELKYEYDNNMYFIFGEAKHLELISCKYYQLCLDLMKLKGITYIQSLAVYGKGRYIGFSIAESFNVYDRETKRMEEFKLFDDNDSIVICNKYYFVVAVYPFYKVYCINMNKVEKIE